MGYTCSPEYAEEVSWDDARWTTPGAGPQRTTTLLLTPVPHTRARTRAHTHVHTHTHAHTHTHTHAQLLTTLSQKTLYEPWDVSSAISQSSLLGTSMSTSPLLTLQDGIYSASYGPDTVAGRSVYGSPSPSSVQDYYERVIANGNGVLSATGVDHASFVSAASSAFGTSDTGTGSTPPKPPTFTAGDYRLSADAAQAHVAVTFPAPSLAAGLVMKAHFDSGPFAGYSAPGLAGFYAVGDDGSELWSKVQEYVSTSSVDLKVAKAAAKSAVVFGTESSYDLAALLTAHGKGPEDVCADIDAVKDVVVKGGSVAKVGRVDGVGGSRDL